MKKYVVLLLSVVILGGCAKNDNEDVKGMQETIDSLRAENKELKSDTKESQEEIKSDEKNSEVDKNDSDIVGLNEEASFGDKKNETIRLKITEVTTAQSAFPDHMIELDNYDTSKMIAVTIEYTNVDLDETFYPDLYMFQAYDKNDKAFGQVDQQLGQNAVAKGRTNKTQIFFETPQKAEKVDYLAIDFVPNDRLATFDVKVSH